MKPADICLWLLLGEILFPSCAVAETIEQAFVEAYQTNPSLAAERARLREVDEQVSQANGFYRPTVDAQANAGRIYQSTPNNPLVAPTETLNTHAVGVQVTQPVFRGFRTIHGVRAAEKQVSIERATLQSTEQQVFLDAGTAYCDVLRDQAVLALNDHFRDVLRHQVDETRARFKARDITKTDVDQAESRLRRAEAGRLQVNINLANHRAAYIRLVGRAPGKLQPPQIELPPLADSDEAVRLARYKNPAVRAADSNVEEAHQEVELSKGSLLPEINLVGSAQRQWGVSDLIPGRQDTAEVLVQMTMPLYRAGTDYSKTRAALAAVTERRRRLEDARRQAEQMVAAAWDNLAAARDVLTANRLEADAAREALGGVRKEVPAGTRNTLDVLNAEQEYMDAQVGAAQAEHDEAVAILQIRAGIGALTAEALKLPVMLYDPDVHYEAVRGKWVGFGSPTGEGDKDDGDEE